MPLPKVKFGGKKLILVFLLCFGFLTTLGLSVYLYILADPDTFGEWLANIHVNIEIDKTYEGILAILTEPGGRSYYLNPTTNPAVSSTSTVIVYSRIPVPRPFYRRFYTEMYLSVMKAGEGAADVIDAIDSIAIFVGNKYYYFSKGDIRNFPVKTDGTLVLLSMPRIFYGKSFLIKNLVNYYGDANIAIKVFCDFFVHPFRYIVSYLFLFCLFFLFKNTIVVCLRKIRQKPMLCSWGILAVIILFGFALRMNGYARHSSWGDEIYSAVIASNPAAPFLNTFSDPGNPPFYFIILRYAFMFFGWSEKTGGMLSVIIGTLAIPGLFILVKRNFNARAATFAALLFCISGYAIDYSQTIRCYILQIFLVVSTAGSFFSLCKKPSTIAVIFYIIPSICLANTHYYGVLFIIANFCFFSIFVFFEEKHKTSAIKRILLFLSVNMVVAVSFLPYLLYQKKMNNSFEREMLIHSEHWLLFTALVIVSSLVLANQKKILAILNLEDITQRTFFYYVFFMPVIIFMLSFMISFIKPMILFRYFIAVSFPFFVIFSALLGEILLKNKYGKYFFSIMFLSAVGAFYTGKAFIPYNGYWSFKESLEYILADAKAHPKKNFFILNCNPQMLSYYGYELPENYLQDETAEVVYVYNEWDDHTEPSLYTQLLEHGFDAANMLKIYSDDGSVVFKKYLSPYH
jgi:4-amino-4-deoxy-L-arabinose transferase-like glycosyltransferase